MYAVTQTLPLPCEVREAVSDRPSAQLEHIKSSTNRKYNSEEVMLKIMVKRIVAITNNTIIEAKETTCNVIPDI